MGGQVTQIFIEFRLLGTSIYKTIIFQFIVDGIVFIFVVY